MADFQIRMEACLSPEKDKRRGGQGRNNDFCPPPPPTSSSLLDLSEKGIATEEEVLKQASALNEEWARVKYLHLDGNRLTQVPRQLLSLFPSLEWLDVRRNRLRKLELDIPSSNRHKGGRSCRENSCQLSTVLLQGNPLEEYPTYLPRCLPSIKVIQTDMAPEALPPLIIDSSTERVQGFPTQKTVSSNNRKCADDSGLASSVEEEDEIVGAFDEILGLCSKPAFSSGRSSKRQRNNNKGDRRREWWEEVAAENEDEDSVSRAIAGENWTSLPKQWQAEKTKMSRGLRDRHKVVRVNSVPSRSTLFHCGLASADLVKRRGEEERRRREEANTAEAILKVLEDRKWKEWVDAWKRSYKGMAEKELARKLNEGGRLLPLPPMGLDRDKTIRGRGQITESDNVEATRAEYNQLTDALMAEVAAVLSRRGQIWPADSCSYNALRPATPRELEESRAELNRIAGERAKLISKLRRGRCRN